jgi:hypothetical protein
MVNLIAAAAASKGLAVQCRLVRAKYPSGVKISDEEMKQARLIRTDFHGEWNYAIAPLNFKP